METTRIGRAQLLDVRARAEEKDVNSEVAPAKKKFVQGAKYTQI